MTYVVLVAVIVALSVLALMKQTRGVLLVMLIAGVVLGYAMGTATDAPGPAPPPAPAAREAP